MFKINEVISQYEGVFDKANEKYFNNELPKPVITIQKSNDSYGHCTNYEAWTDGEEENYFEINLSANYLDRPVEKVCGTLLHEMVHLHNVVNKIKDCNGKYHNAKFRDACEAIGLNVEKTTYGYSDTSLSEEQIEFFESLDLKKFNVKRIPLPKKKSTSKGHKYQCPCCGASFWSSKTLNVHCEDCDEDFEVVN